MHRFSAAGLAGVVALLTVLAPRASGGEACSCTDKDPATAVALEITATGSIDHSRIGAEQENLVVDLRGERTEPVGELPDLLAGADLSTVPVLMAVSDGASRDGCLGTRPPAGADLSLTGHVYVDDGVVVVWTGPCQGELTVAAGEPAEAAEPADASGEDDWEAGLRIGAVVLATSAVLCLAAIAVAARRGGSGPPPP